MTFLRAFVCFIVILGLFNFVTALTPQPKPVSALEACQNACQEEHSECTRIRNCNIANMKECGYSCFVKKLECNSACWMSQER